MRILELHCDYFSQKPKGKAIKTLPELTDEEKKGYRVENALVVFTTMESADDNGTVRAAAEAIQKNFEQVRAATVFINPYAHLSSDLCPPDKAQVLLAELHKQVRKFCPDARKGVFGYYKEFELSCKGHPLSELSKTIRGADEKDLSKAISLTTAKKIESPARAVAGQEILQFIADASHEKQTKTEQERMLAKNTAQFILAAALSKLYPRARIADSSVGEEFFVDIDSEKTLSDSDIAKIEQEMEGIVSAKEKITSAKIAVADALKKFGHNPYKKFLLEQAPRDAKVRVAEMPGFCDLANGLLLANTSELVAFKLSKIGGAYWLNSSQNRQLQRATGTAFASLKERDDYLAYLADAERRDHRKLGKDLKIFMFAEEVGMGLPMWLPNGEVLRHLLVEYMRKLEEKYGYVYVNSPAITKSSLYFASGHLPYYAESMYAPIDIDGAQYYLKPMNCPHHHMMYRELVTSYRDLPLRFAEAGTCYRHELSGTMNGLIRARCFTQNDSHIYITPAQVEAEIIGVLKLFRQVYDDMGITDYWYRLALPDFDLNPEKYGGDRAKWEDAAQHIRRALRKEGVKFSEEKGEAAFYGPKVDVQTRNAFGKEDTIATVQVDILVPKRMGLSFVNERGEKENVVIIHRAIIGSYERFIAFLLEKYAGNLPAWLSPVQVCVMPITDAQKAYAKRVAKALDARSVRVLLDESEGKIEQKIRSAQLQKIPYMLVVGKKEEDEGSVSVRRRDGSVHSGVPLEKFEKAISAEIAERKK
jgi:threonyl-tRNA synthetase